MDRYCEVCGRRIRTGTKYCYECRSFGRANAGPRKMTTKEYYSWGMGWFYIFMGILFFTTAILIYALGSIGTQIIFTLIVVGIISLIILFKRSKSRDKYKKKEPEQRDYEEDYVYEKPKTKSFTNSLNDGINNFFNAQQKANRIKRYYQRHNGTYYSF
jgi:membrane protein insertase Oxa1/YidC/SpoIIIJ